MNKLIKQRVIIISLTVIFLISCTARILKNDSTIDYGETIMIFAVGTGDVGGTFYPAGAAIIKVMNDFVEGVRATAECSEGSVDNSRMVGSGELLFGLAIGDIAYNAYTGTEMFSSPNPNITCLFAIYPSISQWVTLESSNIDSIKDLKGNKISVGMPGSGSEVSSSMIIKAAGIQYPGEIFPTYMGCGEGAAAVRDGHVVAAHTIGGVPFGAYVDLFKTKKAALIPLDKDMIQKIVEEYPFYSPAEIPANSYPGQDESVDSVGIKCLFLANKEVVSEELAYNITKAVWENLGVLWGEHQALKAMNKDFIVSDLPIPLHPGAEKYWKEIGILKY